MVGVTPFLHDKTAQLGGIDLLFQKKVCGFAKICGRNRPGHSR
jgi:hypothetical protein